MSDKIEYKTYEDYNYEDLLVYAGIDCIVTSEIASKMYPQVSREPNFLSITPDVGGKKAIEKNIKAKSVLDMYMDTVGPAQDFIIDLEMNGIVYDVEQNLVIKARMQKEIAELEEEIFSKIGKTINLDSGREIGNFVYYELGLPIQSWSKAGAPSTDGDAMKALAKAHPEHAGWLNILAKRNDIASLYRMFIENYVADFVKPDGRVHPSYNQFGTSSFRISGSDPNLTQLPRSKHGYNLRKLYKVPEGFVFLALDFSSAEVKILGALCKDPSLLKAIKDGLDFHAFSASSMFGIDYDLFMSVIGDNTNPDYKDYKEKRQISKVLTFSIMYGSSPAGIARQLGVSDERAKELIAMYFNLFPGIKTYVESSHRMAISNGMVMGPFGQRKMEFGAMPIFKGTAVYNGAMRNSQNVIVQNTTSTFGLECFCRVNDAIKNIGGKAICTVKFAAYRGNTI